MNKLKLLSLVLAASCVLSLLPSGSAAASFDKDRLIDDSIFDNKDAMTADQIDSFLNSRSYSCISPENGFEAKEPIGYNPDDGFQYGGYVTAGKVIYAAAQAYDLNPRVLLATLQKEQSLVSASSSYCLGGSEHKYAAAVGYGCPDSGDSYNYSNISLYRRNGVVHSTTGTTCVNTKEKAGFTQQVIRAAWVFKFAQQRSMGNIDWAIVRGDWDNSDDLDSCYSGPMTRGNHQVCPSGSTVFYDGYRTIDGVKTYMGTGATAALYRYTPHFHGNENFVEIYESWFGPTTGTPLFRVGDTAPVYILGANNDYYHITSNEVLQAYGYGNTVSGIKKVNSDYLAGKTFSGVLPLVARFEAAEVYMISKARAHHFTSQAMMNTYGYVLGDEAELQASAKPYYLNAEIMQPTAKNADGAEVYSVESGKKRHIIDSEAYQSGSPSYESRPKVELADYVLDTIADGAPILTANRLLMRTSSNSFAYWDGTKRQEVSKRLVNELVINPDYRGRGSAINQLPAGGTLLDKYAKNAAGDLYLLDTRQKYLVNPVHLTEMGLTTSSFALTDDGFLDRATTTKTFRRVFRINNGAAVYLIDDGVRRHINDAAALSESGYSMSQVINLNSSSADLFPDTGKKVLSIGTLFRVGSGDKIYFVNSANTSLHIPSKAIMQDFGLGFDDVQSFPIATASAYPETGKLGHFVKNASGDVFHIQLRIDRRPVSAQMQAAGAYNLNISSLPTLTSATLNRYVPSPGLTNLLKAQGDSKVYKIENGTKRWVTSGAAFNSHGFSWDNVTVVSPAFVKTIPNGSNIN